MGTRKRRRFTEAFKQESVRLCLRHDRSIGQVARELDLTESALRNWVKQPWLQSDRSRRRRRRNCARSGARSACCARSARSLKKRRPSSPRKTREVCVDSRGEGHARRAASVPRAGGDAERVLRLDAPVAKPAGTGQRPAAGTHPGCRQPGHLWEPACPEQLARGLRGGSGACALLRDMGLVGLPARRFRHTTDSTHGRRRPQRARASLRGRPAQPRWTTDITFIRGRAGCIWRSCSTCIGWAAAPRRSWPWRRCSWRWGDACPPPVWCTTPIGAASMPPRPISVCCASMAVCSMSRTGDCWDNAV